MLFDQEYYSKTQAIGIMMRSYMLRESPEDLPEKVPYSYEKMRHDGRDLHVVKMGMGPHTAVLSENMLRDLQEHLYPRDTCVFCGVEYPRILGCPECRDTDPEWNVMRYDPINDTFGAT